MNDRRTVAYHEAGHVLAAMSWGGCVDYATIKSEVDEFGRTIRGHVARRSIDPSIFGLESRGYVRRYNIGFSRFCLGGPAAEELIGYRRFDSLDPDDDDLWWDDTDRARACQSVAKAYPTAFTTSICKRVERQYAIVAKYLAAHRSVLDALANELLERETIDDCRISEIVHGDHTVDTYYWGRVGMSKAA